MTRYAIVLGLRPELRVYVLQQGPTSTAAMLEAAKIAEATIVAAPTVSDEILEAIRRLEMRSTSLIFASSRGRSPSPTAGTTWRPQLVACILTTTRRMRSRHFNSRASRQRRTPRLQHNQLLDPLMLPGVVPCLVVQPDSSDAVANSLAVSTVRRSRHFNNANRRGHARIAHVSTRPACVRRMDKSAELVASETTSLAVAAQRRPHFTTSNSNRRVNASVIDTSLLPMTLSLNVSLTIVLIILWSCE